MPLSQAALLLIGLLLAVWTIAAAIVVLRAQGRLQRAEAGRRTTLRLARLLDESPACPLLVRTDGRIEGPPRLAGWFGLDSVPQYLSELAGEGRGLTAIDVGILTDEVRRTQKTGAPFRLAVTPQGTSQRFALRGHLADAQISPGGAALVWVFDISDTGLPPIDPLQAAGRARSDYPALVTLIEAVPMPMWLRSGDGRLMLANAAYATAVGAPTAAEAVAGQIELIESTDGMAARAHARAASDQARPLTRQVATTMAGARRMVRVTDLPLGPLGIAGYAIDIEEIEELRRLLAATHEARRSVLDNLSTGMAQFNTKRQLTFANPPFQRLFAVDRNALAESPTFERVLDAARHMGRLPEVRDYAEWRRERVGWFGAKEPQEDDWVLTSGVHLRIITQPLPDGELMLIAEDRTEQLRLSAARDTMLRTRTATLDSLFESVAVFGPDGRMQLWNRRFASDWGLENEYLDTHPHIEALLIKISEQLRQSGEAAAVGEAVRAATLERRETGGRVLLANGRMLAYGGVPLPDGNGLLTVLDMTDAQAAEESLRARNAALQDAEAVRARFIAELSQEFQLPLQVIGGFAERLRDGLGGPLNDVGSDYVEAILTSADRIEEQIGRLIALSRSGTPMLADTRDDIDLASFVDELVAERQAALLQADLTLDCRIEEDVGGIRGDRRRLARALFCLIDHAIASTAAGGRILIDLSRQTGMDGSDHPRIVVSDNGPGMDAETLRHARAGQMLDANGQLVFREGELCLPLAHELIKAHGGTLELLSEPGHGTAAIVELP